MTIRIFEGPPAVDGNAERADSRERAKFRSAAHRARQVYPGELGELVHRELSAFAEFGLRLSTDALMARLADLVLATPTPAEQICDGPR